MRRTALALQPSSLATSAMVRPRARSIAASDVVLTSAGVGASISAGQGLPAMHWGVAVSLRPSHARRTLRSEALLAPTLGVSRPRDAQTSAGTEPHRPARLSAGIVRRRDRSPGRTFPRASESDQERHRDPACRHGRLNRPRPQSPRSLRLSPTALPRCSVAPASSSSTMTWGQLS